MKKGIILFDGVCNFCNSSVNFVIDRDPDKHFYFAPLQEYSGIKLQKQLGLNPEVLESVVLVMGGKVYRKSTAALKIARNLKGGWKFLYVFIILPPFIRNWIYDLLAKNRYRWFGTSAQCRIPTDEMKERFILPNSF